jgi:hypothetical protein
MHPERYRQYARRTNPRGMHADGYVFEQRNVGRTYDMMIKAVVAVSNGEVAVIEAHDHRYAENLRAMCRDWVAQLKLGPKKDPGYPAVMSESEMTRLFRAPRRQDVSGDDSLYITHHYGTRQPIRILRDHHSQTAQRAARGRTPRRFA